MFYTTTIQHVHRVISNCLLKCQIHPVPDCQPNSNKVERLNIYKLKCILKPLCKVTLEQDFDRQSAANHVRTDCRRQTVHVQSHMGIGFICGRIEKSLKLKFTL